MPDNTPNTNPPDDPTGLRGGTQAGGTPQTAPPGGPPGGTNALSPTGTARPMGRPPEPPTPDKAADERQDPHRAVEGGRTRPSPDEGKLRARDEADIPPEESRSGHDENNPRQIPEDAPPP
jgi:hypothetical protein